MKQQLTLILLSASLLCAGFIVKILFFPKLTNESSFYFLSLFWICGSLIVVIGLHILWQLLTRRIEPTEASPSFCWPNRRQSFRHVYPAQYRPIIIVDQAGRNEKRQLEYPVMDISEKGLCFLNDGSFGDENEFIGRISFQQGKNIRISGLIVRREGNRMCVQLDRHLAWRTILQEQRLLLADFKLLK